MEDSSQIEKQEQTNEVPALLGYNPEDVDWTDKLAMHFVIVNELRKIIVCCKRHRVTGFQSHLNKIAREGS